MNQSTSLANRGKSHSIIALDMVMLLRLKLHYHFLVDTIELAPMLLPAAVAV